MAESGPGPIRLFNDFHGVSDYIALTADTGPLKDFYAGGEGFEDAGAGMAPLSADALSGVVRLTSGATDADTVFIGTHKCFDVGLMGTIVMEARVRFVDLDAKLLYFGLTSTLAVDAQSVDFVDAGTTTITLTAGSLCGLLYSSELTDDEDWHGIYNGGTTTGEVTSTSIDLDDDAVAGEWQVLRVEVDTSGAARWYIDGELLQTVAGAISTTTDVAVVLAIAANAAEAAVVDVDYLLVKANRDWTV